MSRLGAALLTLAACAPRPAGNLSSDISTVVIGRACADGFKPVEAGTACDAIVHEDPCPAGTMPAIGQTECIAVGTTSCAPGFAPDPSGWGCLDISPAAVCEGATREKLGGATCVPLGDCAAAFPPAAATRFVDPNGPIDSTHFHSINAAIGAAAFGETIAVETGTYVEQLVLNGSITLAGRCAEKVALQGPPNAANAGVIVNGGKA